MPQLGQQDTAAHELPIGAFTGPHEDSFGLTALGMDDQESASQAGNVRTASDEQPAPVAVIEAATQDIAEVSTQWRQRAPRHGVVAVPPQPATSGAHQSHALRWTGHVVWCSKCSRHAAERLGVGLIREYRGTTDGADLARTARLKSGKHPVSGEQL